MRVSRVCSQTVGLIHHTPLAICRLEASDTREVAAEVFGSGALEDPLHVVEPRFHVLKSQFSELKGEEVGPYGRTVVLCYAAENGYEMLASAGKGKLATQWCSRAWSLGGRYFVDIVG